MRPALTIGCYGFAGVVLAVLFLALGDISPEPFDHPAWLVERPGLAIGAHCVLCGFCLPARYLHFMLFGILLGSRLGGRPGDTLNYLTYPLVQGALYAGIPWAAARVGGSVRKMLHRRGESLENAAPEEDSSAQPRPSSRRTHAILVSAFVILYGVVSLVVLVPSVPASWTADYDKDRYAQLHRAIRSDPKQLLGRSLEEVTEELGLKEIPWDDGAVQTAPGTFRIYHFRGFALYVTLEFLPPGRTPQSDDRGTSSLREFQLHGVPWLAHQCPFARIDGIGDREERMRSYWKQVEDECERINAQMRGR